MSKRSNVIATIVHGANRPRRYLAGGLDPQTAQPMPFDIDERGLRARELLEAEWKSNISKLPPIEREAWLTRPEHIAAISARRMADLRRPIDRMRKFLEMAVPSGCWRDDALEGASFPPPGMILGWAQTRYGGGGAYELGPLGAPSLRYFPPQNAEQETFLDAMTPWQADNDPFDARSASAVAIMRIADRRATHEEDVDLESEDGLELGGVRLQELPGLLTAQNSDDMASR